MFIKCHLVQQERYCKDDISSIFTIGSLSKQTHTIIKKLKKGGRKEKDIGVSIKYAIF